MDQRYEDDVHEDDEKYQKSRDLRDLMQRLSEELGLTSITELDRHQRKGYQEGFSDLFLFL
jgi:hypothetical protein